MFLILTRIQGMWGRPCSLIASKPASSGKFSWRCLTNGLNVWTEWGVSLSPWKQIDLRAETFEYCQELFLSPFPLIVLLDQLLSCVWLFVAPWTTACQASLFFTISRSLLKLTSISCPLRCHPTISSSVVPFSSCPQSFPASGSFPMSWFFASGDRKSVV